MIHQSLQIQNSTWSLMDAQQMFVNWANSSQGKGPTKLMCWSPKAEADRYFSVNADCDYTSLIALTIKKHIRNVRQVGFIEGNDPGTSFPTGHICADHWGSKHALCHLQFAFALTGREVTNLPWSPQPTPGPSPETGLPLLTHKFLKDVSHQYWPQGDISHAGAAGISSWREHKD